MLLFLIELYFIIALPAAAILWASLVTAKHSDEYRAKNSGREFHNSNSPSSGS